MRKSLDTFAVLSVVFLFLSEYSVSGLVPSSWKIHHRKAFGASLLITYSGNVPDDDQEDEEDGLVTREMLHRDLLEDPTVKRRNKKGKGYQPLDNRDHLPFAVKQITPDPYTHPDIKKGNQVRLPRTMKSDLEMIGARLSLRDEGDDTSTFLGEFQLDKSTTSGDIIELSNGRQYKVETARCQYKYAGGQRFVMVRNPEKQVCPHPPGYIW